MLYNAKALEIMGAIGVNTPADLKPWHINKRVSHEKTSNYDLIFPRPDEGTLVLGQGPLEIQDVWERGKRRLAAHA